MKDEILNDNQQVREHLANERTLLAWIRTSIGIMAFGFVVVKFSLFVTQFALIMGKSAPPETSSTLSSSIGTLLVVFSAAILLLAYLKFKQTEKQIRFQTFTASSSLVLGLTVVILILSILLVLYLINV